MAFDTKNTTIYKQTCTLILNSMQDDSVTQFPLSTFAALREDTIAKSTCGATLNTLATIYIHNCSLEVCFFFFYLSFNKIFQCQNAMADSFAKMPDQKFYLC